MRSGVNPCEARLPEISPHAQTIRLPKAFESERTCMARSAAEARAYRGDIFYWVGD